MVNRNQPSRSDWQTALFTCLKEESDKSKTCLYLHPNRVRSLRRGVMCSSSENERHPDPFLFSEREEWAIHLHRARAFFPYLRHSLSHIHFSASFNPAQIYDFLWVALWLSPHPSQVLSPSSLLNTRIYGSSPHSSTDRAQRRPTILLRASWHRTRNRTWTISNFVLCWLHHSTYRSEKQERNDHKFITLHEKNWCPVHVKIWWVRRDPSRCLHVDAKLYTPLIWFDYDTETTPNPTNSQTEIPSFVSVVQKCCSSQSHWPPDSMMFFFSFLEQDAVVLSMAWPCFKGFLSAWQLNWRRCFHKRWSLKRLPHLCKSTQYCLEDLSCLSPFFHRCGLRRANSMNPSSSTDVCLGVLYLPLFFFSLQDPARLCFSLRVRHVLSSLTLCHCIQKKKKDPTSKGKPVAVFSSQNMLNQDTFSDTDEFPLRHQQVFGSDESFFRSSYPANVSKYLFLMVNRDHMLAEARSELMKQECKVESLNTCINQHQQQTYAQRLELEDAHFGYAESRREQVRLQEE